MDPSGPVWTHLDPFVPKMGPKGILTDVPKQESKEPLPVLVWIHGGGLTSGSSGAWLGPDFLMEYGVRHHDFLMKYGVRHNDFLMKYGVRHHDFIMEYGVRHRNFIMEYG